MRRRILVLASDMFEPSQRRTAEGLVAAGHDVRLIGYRRGNMPVEPPTAAQVLDLGEMDNGVGPGRLRALLRGVRRLTGADAREEFRRAELILARNLDMALLALWGRWRSRSDAAVIYHCLDIHDVMTSRGLVGRLARWAERAVLKRAARVVVSAPEFLSAYFRARQGFDGEVVIQENRILWLDARHPPHRPQVAKDVGRPLVLGWVGTLRCPRSLEILSEVARRAGPDLRIEMHGVIHHHQLPGAEDQIVAHPNMSLHGTYSYPADLGRIYARLDCVWGQDLWQAGANSDWLLPNRLYEAGYFGCPLIAVAGTATARRLAQDGTGLVVEAPTADAVLAALVEPQALAAARARLGMMEASAFLQTPEEFAATLLGTPTPETRARMSA